MDEGPEPRPNLNPYHKAQWEPLSLNLAQNGKMSAKITPDSQK